MSGPVNPTPSNPVSDFIWGLPPITRALFVSTVAVSLAGNFIVDPFFFILSWPLVIGKFELWRVLSCFFIGKLGFNWAMGLFFLYRHSLDLEKGHYAGRTADYAWLVTVVMALSLLASYFFEFIVLSEPLMMALVYVWSQMAGQTPVGFMFGMTFPAMYLPWVLAGWDLLMTGQVPLIKLLGIVIGHAFLYIDIIYPSEHDGRRLISTPSIFYRMFPVDSGFTQRAQGYAARPGAGGRAAPGRPVWGSGGRRLAD